MSFKDFSTLVADRYVAMQAHELFVVDTTDLFDTYLAAFPAGTNEIFRERTEHDCSCCKNFIRNIGNVVAIIDDNVRTVWDDWADAPYPYNVVGKALADIVRQAPIRSVWRTKERQYGQLTSVELRDDGTTHTWDHFAGRVAAKHFSTTPDAVRGGINTTVAVFERGLRELRLDDFDTVIDLVEANNLLRGSYGYFASTREGEYDKRHLSRAIEELKARTHGGEPLAWFRQSRQNPAAWYQIDPGEVEMHRERGDVVRAVYE